MRSKAQLRVVLAAGAMILSTVGASMASAQSTVTINYQLWDSNQLPPYQQCATDFTAKNPNITIKISQLGWGDYWNGISTGFVAGNAPDVFTDHLAKYPEFVKNSQLLDIQPMVDADKVPTDIYYPGLADLWGRNGKRYGLPKDWDTIATVYNVDMLKAAGIDPKTFDTWTWNPKDGGTFEQVIAKLTLDKNGKNGLDPAFDKTNVVQYGFDPAGFVDAYGQTGWSWMAVSDGFKYNDGPWATKYYYDDPKLAETFDYMASLWLKKGYAPDAAAQSALGDVPTFQAKKVAIITEGSWNVGSLSGSGFAVGYGALPTGPAGRFSMFNGLADSIWVGTQHPKEAWAWVKYLASAACEDVVGKSGVVFPAIPEAAQLSFKARQDKGIDVSAYLNQANQKNGTFLFPITDNASQISQIMGDAISKIATGKSDSASALKDANAAVNALFSQ